MKNIALKTFAIGTALFLGACSTVIDKSSQPISISAVGADEVWCYLEANGVKFKANLPQTVHVKKSRKDLVVDCYGSGNRHIKEVIPAVINETTMANIANLGAGFLYDVHTDSTHVYPDELLIDFTHQTIRKSALPGYMGEDNYKPTNQAIEYIGPTETKTKLDQGSVSKLDQQKNFNAVITENANQ